MPYSLSQFRHNAQPFVVVGLDRTKRPTYSELARLARAVRGFARDEAVSARGGEAMMNAMHEGSAFYLAAVAGNDPNSGGEILGAARVIVAEPSALGRFAGRPAINLEALEVAGGRLVATADAGDSPELGLQGAVAAGMIYAAIGTVDPLRPRDVVRVEGRVPTVSPDGSSTLDEPRELKFFEEIGLSVPRGSPAWGAEGAVVEGRVENVAAAIARLYLPPLLGPNY